VSPPPPLTTPALGSFQLTASPLPAGIPSQKIIWACKAVAVLTAVVLIGGAPAYWFIWAIGAWVAYVAAGAAGKKERDAEKARRTGVLNALKSSHEALLIKAENECGPAKFMEMKSDLARLRDEYPRLSQMEKQELDQLHTTAQERQKQKFLDSFFIEAATISGVGTARKAALRSFGIETAADVDSSRIRQVKGFGEGLTRSIMDWRRSCERKFVFDPNRAVSAADKNVVKIKYGSRKMAIETALQNGAQELRKTQQAAIAMAATLQPQLHSSAMGVAQAMKDLTAL
jgi:DNA-binding helix-hairpin-helix protein with protein kinase domain